MVSTYKAYDQVLIHKGSEKISELTIANLINGITEEFSDMGTMIKNEEVIKNACESFKNRLLVMETFGSKLSNIEFPSFGLLSVRTWWTAHAGC